MSINGPFVLALIIAVVSIYLAVTLKNWVAKLILFIVALGASGTAAGIFSLGVEWVLLINTFLFLVTGITSVRVKHAGNRVLGFVLIPLGIVLFFLTLNAFGATPGTIVGGITESFKQGWANFVDILQQAVGST